MAREKNQVADSAPNATYLCALAAVKLLKEVSVVDLTVDDYDFLIQDKLWLPVDRSRARRCVEAVVYGGLDYVGYPRFEPPVEFVAAAIVTFVHPQNIQTACLIMEGGDFCYSILNGVEQPVSAKELFAHVLCILSGDVHRVHLRDREARESLSLKE